MLKETVKSAPSCPICNSKRFRNLFSVEDALWRNAKAKHLVREHLTFQLGQCQICGHIMITDEKFTPRTIKRLYTTLSTHSQDHPELIAETLSWIKELPVPEQPVIIDFGCGGFLLLKKIWELFSKIKPNLIGIDFNPLAKSVVPPGIEFIYCDLNEITKLSGVKFHVGLLSSVLEHVLYPRRVMEGIVSLMADDGWLYIEVPISDAISNCTGLKYELVIPQHIHYYTADNLIALFRQCGLAVAKQETGLFADFPRGRFLLTKTNLDTPVAALRQYVDNNRHTKTTAANNIVNLQKKVKRLLFGELAVTFTS